MILPGLPGILRRRVPIPRVAQFILGCTALVCLLSAASALFDEGPHYSLDPLTSPGGVFQVLVGRSSESGVFSNPPGTIVLVAEVPTDSSTAVSVERLVSLMEEGEPYQPFETFWPFFWLYVVLYIACAVWSLRDELRRPAEGMPA